MSELKILHAADLHLDSPFEGLGAAKAAQRREEQRRLLYRIAQLAETEHVDLVLLAGDLLDSDSTYAETAEALAEALGSISAPVFISPGNHDFYSPRSPYARVKFPENVHIFKSPAVECVELPQLGVRVWGAAFCDKYSPAMLHGFSAAKSAGVKDVMCIHGEVAAASNYNPITELDIAASGMDYIALGHIHKESGLKKSGAAYYAWPGCPEGRGFDETGEKYVYIVSLGISCAVKPVCVAQRKYEILNVELTSGDVINDVLTALPENTSSDIYRIILRGETAESPQLDAVAAALEDKFFSLQVRDETVLKRDMWQSAGEDNLRGQFLSRLKAALDAAKTDAEREKISQAARWGLAALDNREEVVRHDDKKA
jgi:DNA repair protein SbcD/Mre11